MVKRQFTLKNVIKNDQKLVMGWVGIKMPWVENRKYNNRVGGGVEGRLFGTRDMFIINGYDRKANACSLDFL